MSTGQLSPEAQEKKEEEKVLLPGEFGVFLKGKEINSIPLGNDASGIEMFEIETKDLTNACQILKNSPETLIDSLVLITTTDLKKGYQSVYTLSSIKTKKSLRVKVTVPKTNPIVPTVSHIWSAAKIGRAHV